MLWEKVLWNNCFGTQRMNPDQTVLTITKVLIKTTNCAFRAKKVEGHDQKFFSGAWHRIGAPTFAPDRCPPNFQIRCGATGSVCYKTNCHHHDHHQEHRSFGLRLFCQLWFSRFCFIPKKAECIRYNIDILQAFQYTHSKTRCIYYIQCHCQPACYNVASCVQLMSS